MVDELRSRMGSRCGRRWDEVLIRYSSTRSEIDSAAAGLGRRLPCRVPGDGGRQVARAGCVACGLGGVLDPCLSASKSLAPARTLCLPHTLRQRYEST